MTKAQIHFSNDLIALAQILKEELFPIGAKPFEKRLIAVPHMALKDFLMLHFAKDPEFQVAAGMQIVSLDQAYCELTKKNLPKKMELSLFLQHELLGKMDRISELKEYFSSEAKDKRIGPFCDLLATYFLRYGIYGKEKLPHWQEELFEALPWVFPKDFRGKGTLCSLHLFGFSFLPQTLLDFYQRQGAKFYFFSPCRIFWGDFYSDKELAKLELDLFENQNLFLSNWGKVGRKMQLMVEEASLPSDEHYTEFHEQTTLATWQNALLDGNQVRPKADPSIQFFSASNRLREVEILKDALLSLFASGEIEPKDVQVFAPNINDYIPFLEAVFEDVEITLSDVTLDRDPFDRLIALVEKRFSVVEVLQVLSLMREDFDLGKIRRFVEGANVRWGISKEGRKAQYLDDLPEEEIATCSSAGTWEEGFKKLILGLGQLGKGACPIVGVTEIEEFNLLYTTLTDLADDLSPLFDGTKWTIPTWLRYLACLMESYLPIEPDHKGYKELLRLASATDFLDQHEIPFSGIKRVLEKKKGTTQSGAHLQAIRFSSLAEGCLLPSKVIAFLGLEEEAFPRRDTDTSLYTKETTYRPKKIDIDKYLFLQGLIFAKERIFLSYVRDSMGKRGASLVYQELLGQIEGAKILHHPDSATDPRYFGGDLCSYNQAAYSIAKAKLDPPAAKPLIPSLSTHVTFEKTDKSDFSLKQLFKFARHPLRYHLHEILGIYPDFGKSDTRDYLLDPITRSQLVKEALAGPIDEAVLPLNLFHPLAKSQIESEVELWKEATGGKELKGQKIDLQVGPYRLKGILENTTEEGWFLKAKDTLEDRIRCFPQLLLAKHLDIPLTFIQDKSQPQVGGSLESYLDYFALAQEHPSPMVPSLGKALLEQDATLLQKGIKQLDDEIWTYLQLRDPVADPLILLDNWGGILSSVFGGILAEV